MDVTLSTRRPPELIPSYSLTGDVLSFARCGLQYRLSRRGNLPASRPVQLWFGEFVHGVLEDAYRMHVDGTAIFTEDAVKGVQDRVIGRLHARGLFPRSTDVEEVGRRRARVAVLEMGPLLFPLISHAEVRLTSTRRLDGQAGTPPRYQMSGVVDVIGNVSLQEAQTNPLVEAFGRLDDDGPFEVIVDYKGMRRPPVDPDITKPWGLYEQQIQTYAELRERQGGSLPVKAGAIIYLNELAPSKTDLRALLEEDEAGTTDVSIDPGLRPVIVDALRSHAPNPETTIPLSYRLRRAVRTVHVDETTRRQASATFDRFAGRIEESRATERSGVGVLDAWPATRDERTCAACDFKPSCPEYPRETVKVPDVGR